MTVSVEDGDYKPQKERMSLVVNRLMSVNPLFFELLHTMNLYVSKSISGVIDNPTALTYSDVIMVNPDFMDKLDDIELLFVIDHELNHYINGHTSFNTLNVKPEYKELLNIAEDLDINYRIIQETYYCRHNNKVTSNNVNKERYKARLPIIDGKQFGCYDEKYDYDWEYRSIFKDLVDNANKIYVQFDKHLTPSDIEKLRKAGVPIKTTTKAEVAGKIASSITKASGIGDGDIPDYIRNIVGSLTEPQFDYYDLLYGIVESQLKTDASWERPKRKYLDSGYYLPDRAVGEKFKAGFFFDLSGSISENELNKFASEYFGLLNQLEEFELHVGCFSTKVHPESYKVFTKDDYDAEKYTFSGTGGTDLSCVTDFLKDNRIELDNLIVLTDGYTNYWPDPDYCKNLIILCTSNVEAPVGRTLHINLT